MSALASREAGVWAADPLEALRLVGEQRLFAREHIGQWVPRFCIEAKKLAESDFYKSVLDVIKSVTEWDAALLDGLEATASTGL